MTTQLFVDGVTLSAASWFNDVDTSVYSALTSVAGLNTLTATGPASLTAYASGKGFTFTPVSTNTTSTTIAITGASTLAARNIFRNGAACVGGELRAGVPVHVLDDGTQFNLVGFSSNFKVGTFTRDISTASGTQAVTGVGFQPRAVIFIGGVDQSAKATRCGLDDGTTAVCNANGHNLAASTDGVSVLFSLNFFQTSGDYAQGKITTLGSDGFTITWTKTGSPTGTVTIGYLAIR